MDYQVTPLRRFAIGLHERMLRTARALDRAGDVGAAWFVGFIAFGVAGIAGALWLPMFSFGLDGLIWAVLWSLVNAAVCWLLRWARRRRYGDSPPKDVLGVRDAVSMLVAAWLGVLALVLCLHDLATEGSMGAWTALLGAGLLGSALLVAYRYVSEPPQDEDA